MECCVNALVTSFKETILAECPGMIKRNETESESLCALRRRRKLPARLKLISASVRGFGLIAAPASSTLKIGTTSLSVDFLLRGGGGTHRLKFYKKLTSGQFKVQTLPLYEKFIDKRAFGKELLWRKKHPFIPLIAVFVDGCYDKVHKNKSESRRHKEERSVSTFLRCVLKISQTRNSKLKK